MFVLLGRAFWMPVRKPWDVLKIFWPLIIIGIAYSYILPYLTNMLLLAHADFPEISTLFNIPEGGIYSILILFLILFLISYFIILIYDGLIKWHRHIILNEPAGAITLTPQKRNWRYMGWSLFFITAGILIHIFITRKLLPPVNLQIPIDEKAYTHAINMTMLRYSLTLLIFTIIFGNLFLKLPKNAVGDSSFSINADLSFSEKIVWTLTVLIATAIIMGAFIALWKQAPIPEFSTGAIPIWLNKESYTLHLTLSLTLIMYGGFVMLTLLSMGYKRVVYGE